MPDKNCSTPELFASIQARACNLKDGIALALSITQGSDSQARAFCLVSGRLDTTVIRPLQEALVQVLATQESILSLFVARRRARSQVAYEEIRDARGFGHTRVHAPPHIRCPATARVPSKTNL
jgi:hypothetical protein